MLFSERKNNRCFRSCWYDRYKWLKYSVSRDAVFCFPFRKFYSHTKENIFTTEGYKNLKHTLVGKDKGFLKHNSSLIHISAMQKWEEHKNDLKSAVAF